MEKRLEDAYLLLGFWFAPWGAAKGAMWADELSTEPYSAESCALLLDQILKGDETFSDSTRRMLGRFHTK